MVEGSSDSDLLRILRAIKSSEIVENRVQLFTELRNLDFKDISNFTSLVDSLTVSLTLATFSYLQLRETRCFYLCIGIDFCDFRLNYICCITSFGVHS